MKNLIIIIFPLFTVNLFAQNVSVKKDVIYRDEQPYAKIIKSGSVIHNFSIQNLDGDEILMANYNQNSQTYMITFIGSGQQTMMKGDFNFARVLAKEVVANNLIKDNKLNSDGERRFMLAHPYGSVNNGVSADMPVVNQAYNVQTGAGYNMVGRNRNMAVMIIGKNIMQGNAGIGSYAQKNSIANGSTTKIFSFYLPDHTKVAEASIDMTEPGDCRIIILKDNTNVRIALNVYDDLSTAREVAIWLVNHDYL